PRVSPCTAVFLDPPSFPTRRSSDLALLEKNNNHWEETFWLLLARNFGIKVNSDAFEKIAASLPVTILAKHKNQIHQVEALLFGQDRKSTRLNSSHVKISYAVFCLKK